MTQDADKKTVLEQYIVLGLLVIFAIIFVKGPLRQFGSIGLGAPASPAKATSPSSLVSAPMQPVSEQAISSKPESVSAASDETPAYAAQDLRDPLESWLPEEPKTPQTLTSAQAVVAQKVSTSPPSLQVQGIIWGADTPQAIINHKVVRIGDSLEGARVTAIDRRGVTLEFQGETIVVHSKKDASPSGRAPAAIPKRR